MGPLVSLYDGDLTNTGAETDIRHAWICPHQMYPITKEVREEGANILCHVIGRMPPFPEALGGIPVPAIGNVLAAPSSSSSPSSVPPFTQSLPGLAQAAPSSSSSSNHRQQPPETPPTEPSTMSLLMEALQVGAYNLWGRLGGSGTQTDSLHEDIPPTVRYYEGSGQVHVQHDTGARDVYPAEELITCLRSECGSGSAHGQWQAPAGVLDMWGLPAVFGMAPATGAIHSPLPKPKSRPPGALDALPSQPLAVQRAPDRMNAQPKAPTAPPPPITMKQPPPVHRAPVPTAAAKQPPPPPKTSPPITPAAITTMASEYMRLATGGFVSLTRSPTLEQAGGLATLPGQALDPQLQLAPVIVPPKAPQQSTAPNEQPPPPPKVPVPTAASKQPPPPPTTPPPPTATNGQDGDGQPPPPPTTLPPPVKQPPGDPTTEGTDVGKAPSRRLAKLVDMCALEQEFPGEWQLPMPTGCTKAPSWTSEVHTEADSLTLPDYLAGTGDSPPVADKHQRFFISGQWRTPVQWLMAQLNRGSNIDQIQERAAAISPNDAGSGSGLGPGMSAAIGATHARQFQRAVLVFLETVKAESLRKSGPADKKLLKDIRQKAPGSFSHHAQRKKPFEDHDIISGVGALPALGGILFDVDWDNVTAFMGLLQSLEVAGPEDSGDWHMVQPFNRYHGSSRFQRISNRPILEN